MNRAKLVTCLAAAAITFAGALSLARPAQAATELLPCTREQREYVVEYAEYFCGGGFSVESCQARVQGGFTFEFTCDD